VPYVSIVVISEGLGEYRKASCVLQKLVVAGVPLSFVNRTDLAVLPVV
jgi:hypothetical protein